MACCALRASKTDDPGWVTPRAAIHPMKSRTLLASRNVVGEIKLLTMPTPRSRPYGIIVSPKGVPTLCLFGTNKLATIDPNTMEIKEYALPDAASRPRRIAIVCD